MVSLIISLVILLFISSLTDAQKIPLFIMMQVLNQNHSDKILCRLQFKTVKRNLIYSGTGMINQNVTLDFKNFVKAKTDLPKAP